MTRHKDRFTFALKLGGIYFLASLFLLTLLGAFVLTYWYPDSTWKILSTSKIFGIIVLSQIACGPLLIIIVSSSKKEKKELTQDIIVIATLQLVALSFGMYTLESGRPAAYVLETDRIVLVSKNELYGDSPTQSITNRHIPWHISKSSKVGEQGRASLELSLQGISPATRPATWTQWNWESPDIQQAKRPITNLNAKILKSEKLNPTWFYIPLVTANNLDWIAIFNTNGDIKRYLPIDGF